MPLILLNNLQILNLNCQTIRISWGLSFIMTTNLPVLLMHERGQTALQKLRFDY